MIDLIRQSAVPSNVMRSASKGALTLPAGEILEILVYLTASPVFAKDAAMTLAGWEEKSCVQVLADPQTPWGVPHRVLMDMPEPERISILIDGVRNHKSSGVRSRCIRLYRQLAAELEPRRLGASEHLSVKGNSKRHKADHPIGRDPEPRRTVLGA